jgi:UDP-N-acetylglucosamine/UDP-N-acetyl-alpha-D-glucosaminouronate 4-epimerase
LQKPKKLVTGGAGFIGSNLVAALAARGETVRALDNLVTGHWGLLRRVVRDGSAVEEITADIRDASAVARAMEGIEIVFHQAALGSVPRSVDDPVESDQVNVDGTVVVLDQARRAGVRRVVFAASSAVYGDTPTLPKREDMTASPMSPYAVTKLTCEHYMRVFASLYGMETVSLRYFNVFGPNQRPDGPYAAAIPRFIHASLARSPITVFGDGEQTRDFCFIDNVVSANLLAADTKARLSGQVVNIAGGRRVSLRDLIGEIGRVLGRELEVKHHEPRPGDVRHSLADIARAKELFGYEPIVKWEDGIPRTVEFLRDLMDRRLG